MNRPTRRDVLRGLGGIGAATGLGMLPGCGNTPTSPAGSAEGFLLQGFLRGTFTNEAIANFLLSWSGAASGSVQGSNGEFSLRLPAGEYTLRFSGGGILLPRERSLTVGGNMSLEIDAVESSYGFDPRWYEEIADARTPGVSGPPGTTSWPDGAVIDVMLARADSPASQAGQLWLASRVFIEQWTRGRLRVGEAQAVDKRPARVPDNTILIWFDSGTATNDNVTLYTDSSGGVITAAEIAVGPATGSGFAAARQHAFGHALGLVHSTDGARRSIMNPDNTGPAQRFAEQDRDAGELITRRRPGHTVDTGADRD